MASQTTVTTTQLPSAEKKARETLLKAATSNFQNFAPQFFPGNTFADLSPFTRQAGRQLAGAGQSPFNQAILGEAGNTLDTFAALQQRSTGIDPSLAQATQAFAMGSPPSFQAALQGNALAQNAAQQARSTPSAGFRQAGDAAAQLFGSVQGPANVSVNPRESARTALESRGEGFLNPVEGTLSAFQGLSPGANPFAQSLVDAVTRQNTQNFLENVLPTLRNSNPNFLGSTRGAIAEGLAAERLARANADAAANILARQFNEDANRALQAASLGGQLGVAAGQQQLARVGQDRDFGLQSEALQQQVRAQDLNRNLQTLATAGQLGLGQEQAANSRLAQDRDFGLQGLQLGQTQQNLDESALQNRIGLGLTGAQVAGQLQQMGDQTAIDAATRSALFLPTAQQLPLFGTEQLLRAGDIDQQFRQQIINDRIARHNFQQNLPEQQLRLFSDIIAGNTGGASIQSQTQPGVGPFQAALGGAVTGAGLASELGLFGKNNPLAFGLVGLGALAGLFG